MCSPSSHFSVANTRTIPLKVVLLNGRQMSPGIRFIVLVADRSITRFWGYLFRVESDHHKIHQAGAEPPPEKFTSF
jgi:hypothetical protein